MPHFESEVARQPDAPLRPRERQEIRVLIQRMYNQRAYKAFVRKLVGGVIVGVGAAYTIAQLAQMWRAL